MKLIARADKERIVEIAEAFGVTKVIGHEDLATIADIKTWVSNNFEGRHKISLSLLPDSSFAMEVE